MVKLIVLITAFISVTSIYCLVMVPERANVTEINEKYVHYAKIYITRLSRSSPYFINIEGNNKQPWTNNVTAHFYFYEYLHNEYRRTFVEIHTEYCDFVEKDFLIGKMLADKGLVCPLLEGDHRLFNMSLPMKNFQYQLPFKKFRVVIEIKEAKSGDVIAKAYLNGVINNK